MFMGKAVSSREARPLTWGVIIFVNRLPKRTPQVQSNGALYQGRHSNLRDRVPMFRGEARILRYRVPMLRISDPHLLGRMFIFGAGCAS